MSDGRTSRAVLHPAEGPAGLELEFIVQAGAWPAMLLPDPTGCEEPGLRIAAAISEHIVVEGRERAVVALADDAVVQALNARFRAKDAATNVLSFPAPDMPTSGHDDGARAIGDVILAFETVEREALEQSKTIEAHATHLIVHGVLHLFGYDHDMTDDAEEMEALEIDILAHLNISNPYIEELVDP